MAHEPRVGFDWAAMAEESARERLPQPVKRVENWVPAGPIAPRQPQVDPLEVANIENVWSPTVSPSRDSVSAIDRAKAMHIRAIPIYAAVIGVAIAAVILYSVTLWFAGVEWAPFMADRVLLFLGVTFGLGMWVYLRINDQDHAHSHAGVERYRIDAAVEVRIREIDADLELRREGLRSYMKLLGVDDARG